MKDVDFASYADHNISILIDNDLYEVNFKLQSASKTLFQWFLVYLLLICPKLLTAFLWPSISWIKCVWFQFTRFKADAKLFIKQETKN